MISKQFRQRAAYVAASLFLAWHTVAIIFAPAPDNSVIAIAMQRWFNPYLTLLRQDNLWDFFAPTVDPGYELRYTVEDASGHRETFAPANELSRYHPSYFWTRSWYYSILDEPDTYAGDAAAFFCRKHADLHPVAITFSQFDQTFFSAEDYRSGKRPTDPEFFTETEVKRVACPNS